MPNNKKTILYITEKQSQVEALAPLLGVKITKKWYPAFNEDKTIIIAPLQGHILENYEPEDYNPEWKSWENYFIFPDKFKLKINKDKKFMFDNIKKLIAVSDEIVIATDFDREGAAIAYNVIEACNATHKITKMLEMGSVDYNALKKALSRDAKIPYKDMAIAGRARSFWDWVTGVTLTRASTNFIGQGELIVYGGVKAPLLAMIVDRDLQFENHKKTKYYYLVAKIKLNGEITKQVIKFKTLQKTIDKKTKEEITKEIINDKFDKKEIAESIKEKLLNGHFEVTMANQKKVAKQPPKLYETDTISAEAVSKKFATGNNILDILQNLYNTHKITTYPRTNIPYLKTDELENIPFILRPLNLIHASANKINLDNLMVRKTVFKNEEVVAHGAIVPTGVITEEKLLRLNEKEKKVYELIAKRFIANFLPNSIYLKTNIILKSNIDSNFGIVYNKNNLIELGWEEVYDRKLEEKPIQLTQKVGDIIEIIGLEIKEGETKPKGRYTFPTLIADAGNIANMFPDNETIQKYLKKAGIGTPATLQNIIKEMATPRHKNDQPLISINEKGQYISTEKGREIVKMMPKRLYSPIVRASLMKKIEEIEKGNLSLEDFLKITKQQLEKDIKEIKEYSKKHKLTISRKNNNKNKQEVIGKCPICDGDIIESKKIFLCSNAKFEKNSSGKIINKGCKYIIFKNSLSKWGGKELTKSKIKKVLKGEEVEVSLVSKSGKLYKKQISIDNKYGIKILWSDS